MGLVNGGEADGNIPHGALLAKFAEAVVSGDPEELVDLRAGIVDVLGPEGLVDSAAVIGLFNAIDRVADSTGIPLEDWKAEDTVEMRQSIGVTAFPSGRG